MSDLSGNVTEASSSPEGRHSRRLLPPMDTRQIGAVFLGGALGTLARAGLSQSFPEPPTAWPWPTFAVNMVAALTLGYFVTRLEERLPPSSFRRPFVATGICGGLSTFSTMQVELYEMLRDHAWPLALGYGSASLLGGYFAVCLSSAGARRARAWR